MIGRTHGIHAEPTTFGAKVALWALQVDRDRDAAARRAATRSRSCKLSGAVGTYSNIDPAVEALVGDALGLDAGAGDPGDRPRPPRRVPVGVRIGRRDDVRLIAVELRHLQRTEVREVQEGFKPGQKGSSAMPHKRNPISAETISGLSRVLRGQPAGRFAGRGAVARARHLALLGRADRPARLARCWRYYVMRRLTSTARRAAGRSPSACSPISRRATVWCSASRCCWRWCRAGSTRDDAYRIVQDNAMRAWDEGATSGRCSRPTPRSTSARVLDDAFDLHAGRCGHLARHRCARLEALRSSR